MPLGRAPFCPPVDLIPDPADEGRHLRHGAGNHIVVPFGKRFGPGAEGGEVGEAESLRNALYDLDFLADRVHGREMRLGEEDRQRNGREAAAAPHVEHPRSRGEGADLGDGERVQHVPQVKLVEILARDHVDLGVPVGVQCVQRLNCPRCGRVRSGKYLSIRAIIRFVGVEVFFRQVGVVRSAAFAGRKRQDFSSAAIRRHICSRARWIWVLTVPSGSSSFMAISS